jgi:hypothetical protein
MKTLLVAYGVALAALGAFPFGAEAQETRPARTSRRAAYHAAAETSLQGTVQEYNENSARPPVGAHVTVQTANGTVEVHLGPASYLHANHFSLAPGDSVRFIGAMASTDKGVLFMARIAQKGSQAIAIRSPQGFLLATGAARTMPREQRAQADPVRAR